jgi:hypothetical protein
MIFYRKKNSYVVAMRKKQGLASMSEEQKRLEDPILWQKWGPYVAERSWGTVREDYSWNGDAWNSFPQNQAPCRANRWGEDGLAGWCDRYQVLAFCPAFWNTHDPMLKERLFGLSNEEGNHGEDVKECYYYLDGTPTSSYMKYLYKYPQNRFPYEKLVEENRRRSAADPEYELIDTGIFSKNEYFDIFIEYAKESPDDICIKIEAFNRADHDAPLHMIPQIWFRNQWGWGDQRLAEPVITKGAESKQALCLIADDTELLSPSTLAFDYHLGKLCLFGSPGAELLFTNNESHGPATEYYKDGFHRAIVNEEHTVNLDQKGTKACFHYVFPSVKAKSSQIIYLRLRSAAASELSDPLADVEEIVAKRKAEADQFYATVHPKEATKEECLIQRQALAGMLWNKQIYLFDVNKWLEGDSLASRPPESRLKSRNFHWRHLNSMRILSMPDKWEFPWFAAWDLAFQSISLGLVDIEFAKDQLWLLLFDQFQHPNGQIPAYEWEFSEMNPPIQGWCAWRLYSMQKSRSGKGDIEFLKRCLHKLMINFTWWVNKVDSSGSNVFEGGFLGLDNIAIVDRNEKFAEGAHLEQSDGTGWMGMFCLNLMRICLEIAKEDRTYESLATKFFEHFVYIASAMKKVEGRNYEIWSEEDGFFYDVLVSPDGKFEKFSMRSLVGIIPLFAVEVLTEEELSRFPEFKRNFEWFLKKRAKVVEDCVTLVEKNGSKNYLLSLVNEEKLSRVLTYVWSPKEFRSDYGLRSLSKYYEQHPYVYKDRKIGYEPGESLQKLMGGNSNWRGPVWLPASYLFIESMKTFATAFPDETQFPKGIEGDPATLQIISETFAKGVISIFKKGENGTRPFWGEEFPFSRDPHWKDYICFNEYFHGDTGKGLGASHQTGWTGLIANLIDEFPR